MSKLAGDGHREITLTTDNMLKVNGLRGVCALITLPKIVPFTPLLSNFRFQGLIEIRSAATHTNTKTSHCTCLTHSRKHLRGKVFRS